MENKEEKEKVNYDILKHQLLLLAKEFNSCEGILDSIKEIKDKNSFRKIYCGTQNTVNNHFGYDTAEDEVDRLRNKVDRLEHDKSKLEDEVDDFMYRFGEVKTFSDEYKVNFYLTYSKNFTEWEIKDLFENGRYFLGLLENKKVA